MNLLRRTADILAANLNDLVDRFEDPARMLRQALREMESLVEANRAAVARSIASETLLARSQQRHAEQADLWRKRAVDAVADGDDALARRALERKREHERGARSVEQQLVETRAANDTLRRQLDALVDKYSAARTRLMLVMAEQSAAEAQRQAVCGVGVSRAGATAVSRFERFYAQVELAHAEATALVELEDGGELALEAQFDRRATERAIDAELAELKSQK